MSEAETSLLVAEETKADDTCAISISKPGEDENANLKECKNANSVKKYDAKSQPHQKASRKQKQVCAKSRPILKISLSLFSKKKPKINSSSLSGSSVETIESQTCDSDKGIKNGVDNNVVAKEVTDSTPAKKREKKKPRPSKVCDLCDKVFADSSSFAKHKRVHIKEKPYKCSQCHKAFRQSNDLKRHTRMHSGKLDFSCDKCSRTFSCPDNLKRHKVVHMQMKPFQCCHCRSSFTRMTEWKYHTKIHIENDLFKCHLCGMSFSRASSVKRHLLNEICRVSPEIVEK